jgi:hypothetical protein
MINPPPMPEPDQMLGRVHDVVHASAGALDLLLLGHASSPPLEPEPSGTGPVAGWPVYPDEAGCLVQARWTHLYSLGFGLRLGAPTPKGQ